MVSHNILFKAVDEPMNIVEIRFGTKTFKVLEEVIWGLIPRVDSSFTDVYSYDLMIDSFGPNNEDLIIETIQEMFAYGTPDIDIPEDMTMLDRFILMKFVDMNFTEKCSSFGITSNMNNMGYINFYPREHTINVLPIKDVTYKDLVNMIIDCNHGSFEYIDKKIINDAYNSLLLETGLGDLYIFNEWHKCEDDEEAIEIRIPDKNNKIIVPLICGNSCGADSCVKTFHKMLGDIAKKMGLKRKTGLEYPELCYYMEQADITCVDYVSELIMGDINS